MNRTFMIIALLLVPGYLFGQISTIATQTLTLEVRPVALLEVSGDPQALQIQSGAAGSGLYSVQDQSTSYRLTTNMSDMKLSVSIDEPVPDGTRLFVEMQGGTGTSTGKIDISKATIPLDAITGIAHGISQSQGITYTFEADAHREAFISEGRTVILTLTN